MFSNILKLSIAIFLLQIPCVLSDKVYQMVANCAASNNWNFGGGSSVWSGNDVVLASRHEKDVYCNSYDIVGGGGEFVAPCSIGEWYYQFTYNSCENMGDGHQVKVWVKGSGGPDGVESAKVEVNGKTFESDHPESNTEIIPIGASVSSKIKVEFTGPDDLFDGKKN